MTSASTACVVTANVAADPNYTAGSLSGTAAASQATATVTLTNMTQTYTGFPLTPSVTTSPGGLTCSLAGAPDTPVGTYPVSATCSNANYVGSASGTFTINPSGPTGTVVLAESISGKTGAANGVRTWTFKLTNNGTGQATSAQMNGLTLVQTFGTACTPVIQGAFPVVYNPATIPSGGFATASVSIDFTSCTGTPRFTVTSPYQANNGSTVVAGTATLNNQVE